MMNKLFLPVLLISSLFLTQCNSSSQQDAEASNGDDMAQFSEDQNFRDAHEKPDSLAFRGKGSMMEFSTPVSTKLAPSSLPTAVTGRAPE